MDRTKFAHRLDITSLQNPLVKRIRRFQRKRQRTRDQCFWAEGVRTVLEAFGQGWEIEVMVWSPQLLLSDRARELATRSSIQTVAVSEQVFHKLSDSDEPQGLGALIRIPSRTMSDLTVGRESFFVVLEDPRDRGNIGAAVRNVDCAGGSGVVLLGESVNPVDSFDPRSVRVSMGSIFSVPIVPCACVSTLVSWARQQRVRLIATSAHAKQCYTEVSYRRPVALLFGNEQTGLSKAMWEIADEVVRIPIYGRARSLNLSSSVAVMTYHIIPSGAAAESPETDEPPSPTPSRGSPRR